MMIAENGWPWLVGKRSTEKVVQRMAGEIWVWLADEALLAMTR